MRLLMTAAGWETIGLAHQLERNGFLVTRAEDWDDLRYLASHHTHDAVLYTHDLPAPCPETERSALVALRGAEKSVLAIRSGADCAALFDAGADVVVARTEHPMAVAARIRVAVMRRAGHAPPAISGDGFDLDVMARQLRIGGQEVHLTPLQYEFVERLALSSGTTVSRSALLEALYGWEDEPGARVLDTFLHGIRQRIGQAGGNPALIQTRRGAGFVLEASALRKAG